MAAVFVLGHRGMLGRVLAAHLAACGHRVETTDLRFSAGDASLVRQVAASRTDAVVNCAALLPGRGAQPADMLVTNGLLPQLLAAALGPSRLLVHASTDGVFDGSGGPYPASALPDAADSYGLSKRLGELGCPGARFLCVRSSVVDPSAGLLGWLLSQQGSVEGYTNQLWNGVTTLEWAHACEEMIVAGSGAGTVHLTCAEPVTKYELLKIAATVLGLRLQVQPALAANPLNRALIPTHKRAPIAQLLIHLRDSRGAAG